MNDAVVGARVLIAIGRAVRRDVAEGTLENVRRVCRFFLRNIVRERDGHALFRQRQRLLPLGRRDQIGGSELVVSPPSSPVRKLFQRPAEVFFRGDRRVSIALAPCMLDGDADEDNSDQTKRQDFHRTPPWRRLAGC